MANGWTFATKNRRSVLRLTDELKIWSGNSFKYRHDCTHFNWNLGIQMIVVYQFLNALSWCIFYSDLVLSSSVTTVGRPKDSSPWMFVCSPSKILCSIFELTPLYSSWLTDCKWRWFRLFLLRLQISNDISELSAGWYIKSQKNTI